MKRRFAPNDVHRKLMNRGKRSALVARTTKSYERRIAAEARADAYVTAAEIVRRYLGRQYKKKTE
jgi:hypothetical protein